MVWTAVLALCALCCAVACGLAWASRSRGPVRTLATGMAGAATWCAAGAVLAAQPPSDVVVVARLLTTTGALAVALTAYWLARTVDDPHRRPSTTDRAVLVLPPVLVLAALLANPWHQLVYVDTPAAGAGPGQHLDGPLYLALVAVIGVPATLAMVHLVRGLLRSPAHFRPHVRTLLLSGAATTAGVVASLLASRPDHHVDVVPLALAATAVLVGVGLLRRDLLTVVPLARAQLVEDLPDAVVVVDADGTVLDVNASCRALVRRLEGGASRTDVVGRPLTEVLPFAGGTDRHGAGPGDAATPLPGLHLDVRTSDIRGSDGSLLGRALLLRDVSDVVERRLAAERTSARLADEAARDPLTGLLNRRGLRAAADGLAPGSALAAVILDVDHFKAVNDTHGHDAGDAVLRTLATVLEAAAPDAVALARLGGEELAVLLGGLGAEDAAGAAEGLLAAVRGCRTRTASLAGTVELGVTASAGVAWGPAADLSDLLRRADAALYTAKRTGRDRAVLAQSGSAPVPAPRSA